MKVAVAALVAGIMDAVGTMAVAKEFVNDLVLRGEAMAVDLGEAAVVHAAPDGEDRVAAHAALDGEAGAAPVAALADPVGEVEAAGLAGLGVGTRSVLLYKVGLAAHSVLGGEDQVVARAALDGEAIVSMAGAEFFSFKQKRKKGNPTTKMSLGFSVSSKDGTDKHKVHPR